MLVLSGADVLVVPPGINVPKAALGLVAAVAGLGGGLLALLALGFALSGDPDFSTDAEVVVSVLTPISLALFCAWLFHRYADALEVAGLQVRTSLTALAWLGNFTLAAILALYFLDDASGGEARYGELLLGKSSLQLLAAVLIVTSFGCVWAIARSLPFLLALPTAGLLVAALYVSEASSTWLGF